MTAPVAAPVSEPRHKAIRLDNLKLIDPETEGAPGRFTGIASAVGVIDRHNEVIERGAFDDTLAEKGATHPLLWQHDPSQPIGVITLSVDPARGDLVGEGEINLDTQKGREAYSLLKQKAIGAMSIGFNIPSDGAKFDPQTGRLHILKIDIWETSLVTFPANPAALVDSVKQALDEAQQLKAGKVLSSANRSKLEEAVTALQAVLEADTPPETEAKSAVTVHQHFSVTGDAAKSAIGTRPDAAELDGVKACLSKWRAEFERRNPAR